MDRSTWVHQPPACGRHQLRTRLRSLLLPAVAVLLLALLLAVLLPPGGAQAAASAPLISARAAILVEPASGRVLCAHDADARLPMASTTKIMTALVVLESLPLDKKITVSKRAEATEESQLYLRAGEVLTVEDLLYGLMVKSGNDAGVALAEAAAGSVEAFAQKMNEKARSLGLENTHFTNPHGLDEPGHYSSARDLATLTAYAMKNEEFRRLVSTMSFTIPGTSASAPRALATHNPLLKKYNWVTGVKTGYTRKAGYCLVASGTRDGVSLISVVLGAPSSEAYRLESDELLNYGFGLYRRTDLAAAGVFATLPVPYRPTQTLDLVAAHACEATVFTKDRVTQEVRVDRRLVPPVQAGESFGTVRFLVGGQVLASTPLVAASSVQAISFAEVLAYWRDAGPPSPLVTGLMHLALRDRSAPPLPARPGGAADAAAFG